MKSNEIEKINIVLKCKKMFLFEKFDKNIQFNSCWCKAGDFFIWGLKKVVRLKQWRLWGFRFRDRWKESIYKTDRTKPICPSQQDLCFRAWPIYADFTHCLMIICKYLSLRLSDKPAYQRSGLTTHQFVSLFQCIK